MKTSEAVNDLSKALASAQAEMKNAILNRVNPHFKNRYADLAAIRDAVVPCLAKHGIAVIQATAIDEPGFRLVTRLSHSSGQWLEGSYPLALQPNPQAMGSQMTYARRYALSAITGISADEDDDAEASTKGNGNGNVAAVKTIGKITPEQVKTLQSAIVETGADLERFLRYFKVEHVEELAADRYDFALSKLAKKAAA